MDSQEIHILDSLPNSARTATYVNYWRKLMATRERHLKVPQSTWMTGNLQSSKQEDGNSCGVFVLMNADAAVREKPPAIMRHCHVAAYRRYAVKLLLAHATVSTTKTCDLPFCIEKKERKKLYECAKCGRWCHKGCLGMRETAPMISCILCV